MWVKQKRKMKTDRGRRGEWKARRNDREVWKKKGRSNIEGGKESGG